MKFAFCLIGQPFRKGSNQEATSGHSDSYNAQVEAIETHNIFIERQDVECDVFLNVESTQYNDTLKKLYGNYKVTSIFRDGIKSQTIEEGVKNRKIQMDQLVSKIDRNNYDYIVFLRIDIFLKPYFIEKFYFTDNIKFLFITESQFTVNKTPLGMARLCDMFISIPKKHYGILDYKECILHENAMNNIYLPYKNIELVSELMYDSDTEKVKNPYYYITGREERNIKNEFNGLVLNDMKNHINLWVLFLVCAWVIIILRG
jgi:hypothetical protein